MKIGLIAMSGVRPDDPELEALGLTLPGFAQRTRQIASLPTLGLLTLAGQTPREIELEYREVPRYSPASPLPGEHDAVAICSFTARIKDAYALADRYRAAGSKVILGGPHVTALPEEASEHADAVALGEGELVWPQIVADLQANRLAPRYDARGRSFDLADAPMPRYELLDVASYNRLAVQTQRGCPWDCEFCASTVRMSPLYRVKPVAKVIEEIRRIRSLWPHPFIEFADDNTFVAKEHSKRLLRALVREDIRYFTETDVSVADDEDLLALLQDSGCAQVLIGFESSARTALEGLELRSDWKARQVDRYAAAIERIQSRGVSVNGCFVLGLDGSGPEVFDEVRAFVRSSGLHDVQITIQTAFPGTPLYARLAREGRLLEPLAWERCTLFDVNFLPARMSVEELWSGFRNLAEELYGEVETGRRRGHFAAQLRAAEAASRGKEKRHESEVG